MKKILFVIHNYFPNHGGGTQVYTYNLAKELAKRGYEVKIFTHEPESEKPDFFVEKYFDGDVEIIKVHKQGKTFVNRLMKSIINHDYDKIYENILEEFKPDLVHIQHLLNLSLTLIDITKSKGIKVFYSVHDLWFRCPTFRGYDQGKKCYCTNECAGTVCSGKILGHKIDPENYQNPFTKFLVKFDWKTQRVNRNKTFKNYLQKVDKLIVPSEFLKKECIDFGLDENKIIKIQHGIEQPLNPEVKNSIDKNKIKFVFPSHLTIDKGLVLVVDSFEELGNEFKNFELNFHGSYNPEDSHVVEYIQKISESENMKYHGAFTQEERQKIFESADFILVPSLWEDIYGLVVDESIAYRRFVIVSNKGGLPERVIDGKNGKIFNPENKLEFINLIKKILQNPEDFKFDETAPKTWISIKENVDIVEANYLNI